MLFRRYLEMIKKICFFFFLLKPRGARGVEMLSGGFDGIEEHARLAD